MTRAFASTMLLFGEIKAGKPRGNNNGCYVGWTERRTLGFTSRGNETVK